MLFHAMVMNPPVDFVVGKAVVGLVSLVCKVIFMSMEIWALTPQYLDKDAFVDFLDKVLAEEYI